MMALALGCIADDYTGASDLANTLTRAGLRTLQVIGVPQTSLDLPPADAIVLALKSRSVPAAQAIAWSEAAGDWLRARGAARILFKICSTFDSTDAGNIGPVTEALRAAAGGGVVPVTPAFPETGRTVYMGHLFVGRVPLDESPLKDHPLNPMRDANLVRVLQRQSSLPVGLVDRATVAQGPEAVEAQLAELAAAGMGAAILDAVSDGDLATIGVVAARRPLTTGASGLGLGLAQALLAAGEVRPAGTDAAELLRPVGGAAAIVAGSCSRATLEQLAVVEDRMPVLRLEPERLLAETAGEIARVLELARGRLGQGPLAIASSAAPEQVASLQARHGREQVGQRIEQALAEIAAGLVGAGVRRLVVAGGETSGAAVDRLAIPAFRVGPEIAPGVPVLRSAGWTGGELLMALKSGNFGGPDFFARALDLMR
ncbi:MAG: 3-oxo-tetronate kinase [Geminicoccaceae bacterium]